MTTFFAFFGASFGGGVFLALVRYIIPELDSINERLSKLESQRIEETQK